jgi:hypothetical protein
LLLVAQLTNVTSEWNLDDDGAPEIYVTRDVGWLNGGDSLCRLNDDNTWVNILDVVSGMNSEVDGMGLTVADLDPDGTPDLLISDLGDNEVLLALEGPICPSPQIGVERIRSDGADDAAWPLLGIEREGTSRGMVLADGDTDILIANHDNGLVAYRNNTLGQCHTLT